MDLALALGQTVGTLSRGMSEREFVRWQYYARDRMLPGRRIECYLAQIAWLIAKTMGGAAHSTLSDFMFEPEIAVEEDDEANLEAAIEAFQFKPRNAPKELNG